MNSNFFDIYALVVLLVLAVIVPLIGIWDFQWLSRRIREGRTDARTGFYIWILVMEWALVLGFAGYWISSDRGWAPLNLIPAASGWQWLAVGLGVAASVSAIWQMVAVLGSPKKLEEARDQIGNLNDMVPRSTGERRLFGVVAVTAGVCEEILYRGVLLATLTPLVGTWQAVVLSSAIFGLAHSYQGFAGIGKTALVGLAMALLTVTSGSLFVAMLLHAVIDLTSGRIMAAANQEEPGFSDAELQTP